MDIIQEINKDALVKPIPKGQYKSGRFWKAERKRFTSVRNVKPLRQPLSKRLVMRRERQEILAITAQIKEDKKKAKEELRERQKLNKEKRLENERKAEVVQVIQDSRKIKRMSRKQLKYIQTRDTANIKKT